MAQRCGVWLPIQALLLGGIAIALSFTAYAKRIKSGDVYNANGVCVYPDSPAFALGIIAALALLAEQITISVGMRCFCCCGVRCNSKCPAIFAIIIYILSWLAFGITFIALIYTAIVNNHSFLAKHHSEINNNSGICFVERGSLFLGSAYWCIITTVVGLVSYAFWVCGTRSKNNTQGRGVDHELGVATREPQSELSKGQP